MKAIGRHIILEMWGCQNLDSVEIADLRGEQRIIEGV